MNLLTETHQELSSYLSQLENLKEQMDFILNLFGLEMAGLCNTLPNMSMKPT